MKRRHRHIKAMKRPHPKPSSSSTAGAHSAASTTTAGAGGAGGGLASAGSGLVNLASARLVGSQSSLHAHSKPHQHHPHETMIHDARERQHHHATVLGEYGAMSSAVSASFDVLEMDLSVMAQSATVSHAVTRERRLDILPGVVVLRASIKGTAQQATSGGDPNSAMILTTVVTQSGAVVRGVAAGEEPRVVLYLDTGWYHILDRSGLNTLMLLLPRKNVDRALVQALERQLNTKIGLSPRMSSEVHLPLGVTFPTHFVHVTDDGQIRDAIAYGGGGHDDDEQGADKQQHHGGDSKEDNGGDNSNNNNGSKKSGGAAGAAAADLSIIRDLELRRLLESTGVAVTSDEVEVLLNFGVTSLAPAVVETAHALLVATQGSNPSGRAIAKLADTIGSSLTTHEIQGRMHLAVPVCRAAVTAFAALLQLCRHQPAVCAGGAGDAITDSMERCAAALLVGSFETCLGQTEHNALRAELALHIATAISLLQQAASQTMLNHAAAAAAAEESERSFQPYSGTGGAAASHYNSNHHNQRHQFFYSAQHRSLVVPTLSRALFIVFALITPLPAMRRQILDALADSHASQIVHATHSTSTVFSGASASPPKLIDSYVALASCIVLSNAAAQSINVWAARMISVAASGFGIKHQQHQRGYFSFIDPNTGMSNRATGAMNNSSSSQNSSSAQLSGQFVSRASSTALALAADLLEAAISERALATLSSRSVVNRESAAATAMALLTSRVWAESSKEASLAVFQLHVRLCEAAAFLCCFSGTEALESLCWYQTVTTLSTPLRRMASWFGTLFPPDPSSSSSSSASGGSDTMDSFAAAAGIVGAGSASGGEGGSSNSSVVSSSSTIQKALRETMARSACRYLATRAAVDGMYESMESASGDVLVSGTATQSAYVLRGAAGGGGPSAPSAAWLVRCAVLCGTGAVRTEIIGSCAVLLRLQVLASNVLLLDARSGSSSGPSSFLGIATAASPCSSSSAPFPAHFGRTPLGNKRMAMSGGGALEAAAAAAAPTNGKNGADGIQVVAHTTASSRSKNKRVEYFRRCERVWGKMMAQLSATVSACPQPSTAHSVWSTASLIAHRFSQASTIILQKGGTDSTVAGIRTAAAPLPPSLLSVASGGPAAVAAEHARAASHVMANAALMCSSLILSVPQVDTMSTFSGGGVGGGEAVSAASSAIGAQHSSSGALRPPDAASYLNSDAWDGLAEFENHGIFALSEHQHAVDTSSTGNGSSPQSSSSSASWSSSQIDLTPSVQDEAFWYIDRSCEDENESARLMTVSRRRLEAVHDARESAAAPPARCAWFAARAIADFSRSFFRAQQDMFEDEGTMALVCSELASMFFFGSGVQHASAALIPVLACVRQTGDHYFAAHYGSGSSATAAGGGGDDGTVLGEPANAKGSKNLARNLFDSQLARFRQQQQQQRQYPTQINGSSRQNSPVRIPATLLLPPPPHTAQRPSASTASNTTPRRGGGSNSATPSLKRDSVLVETLRSQRMLNPTSDY